MIVNYVMAGRLDLDSSVLFCLLVVEVCSLSRVIRGHRKDACVIPCHKPDHTRGHKLTVI